MRDISGEQIAEAVFSDEAYRALLTQIAEIIGARSFACGWHYHDGTASMLVDSGYWSAEQVVRYDTEFFKTDIWTEAQLQHWQPGCVANMNELVSEREFENSAVWNEFYRSIGDDTWRGLCIGLENSSGIGGIAFHRGRSSKSFDESAERFLNRHAHALARVHALRGRISALEKAVISASHPLDTIANPVFVLTATGRIVHMNAAARELLDRSGMLSASSGVLKASSPALERRLKALIARAAKATDYDGSAISIDDVDGGRINLTITPTAHFRRQPQVMVIADSKPAADPTVEARLRTLYGLSAGEARLATMLAEGLEPAEIAHLRSVALGTVRQQIKSIAAKMECRRQADIVRLVTTLPVLAPPRS